MVVVLVGFMGAGKTTVGHIMAHPARPAVRRQRRADRAARRPRHQGHLHRRGRALVPPARARHGGRLVRGPEAVIAVGGGAVEHQQTQAVLRDARVVYLRVSYDEAMARVRTDEFRPMLARPDLAEVYQRRLPGYEDVSVLTVDTDGQPFDAIARDVLAGLSRLPVGSADAR